MKLLLCSIIVTSLCRAIHSGPAIPHELPVDTFSSTSTHEEVERELLFLAQFTARVLFLELYDAASDVKLTTLTDEIVIPTTPTTNPSFSVNAIVFGKYTRSVALE